MPQHLAIDWSPHEVRFVLATGKGQALQFDAAQAVSLAAGEDNAPQTAESIGSTLREALAAQKVGKMKALVSVGRSSVELHRLSLPPASDAELPVLVANQVSRESATATEASIVDFVADTPLPNQPRQVTAAVLSSNQHDFVRSVCAAAGLTAQRIVLRPYAAAALYSMSPIARPSSCLLIDVVDDEVDLTVVQAGKATFSRTVRFPQSADARSDEWLYAEVTRTLLAAPRTNAEAGGIAGVCLFGTAGEHQRLCELVQSSLNITVETLDPFAAIGTSSLDGVERRGRFASLVGLLAVETRAGSHEIDFVNPRRPPQPKNRRRPLTIAAGLAALTIAAFGYTLFDEFSAADAKIAELKAEIKTLNTQIKKAEEKQIVVNAIEEWQAGDVVWLDELKDLSEKMPGSRDFTVMRMSMSPSRGGGGVITLQGAARAWTVVERMATTLRDDFHEVGVPHQQGRNQDEARGWHFDTSISVAKRTKEEYLGKPAEEAEAPTVATNDETVAGKSKDAASDKHDRTLKQAAN